MNKHQLYCICTVAFIVLGVTAFSIFVLIFADFEHYDEGLDFEPKLTLDATLIEYTVGDNVTHMPYVKHLDRLFEGYRRHQTNPANDVRDCSFDQIPPPDKACHVPLDKFGPCSFQDKYGYTSARPCVFLEFHQILKWNPEYYLPDDDLPESMPQPLKRAIKANTKFLYSYKFLWLTCEARTDRDEWIMGPLEYYPRQGFLSHYFPYIGQKGYMSPLVAVRFKNPAPNIVIHVTCRAWAKNLENEKDGQLGYISFDLKINEVQV